jgi:hypothetical protein
MSCGATALAIRILGTHRQWRQAAAVAHDWGSALRQARRLEQALDAFSRAALAHGSRLVRQAATASGP